MKLSNVVLSGLLALSACVSQAQAAEPLRVAVDPTFPPMEYVENGQHKGFDIEVVEALAAKLGRPVEYLDVDFKGLIPSVLAGRADMVMSAMYITDERKKVVNFTDPYFTAGLVVMVQKGNTTIKTPADLAGKKVAVQVGTKSVQLLKERFPTAQPIEVEKNQEMFSILETGRGDAVITGKPAAFLFSKTRGSTKVLDEQVTNEVYGIAISKNNDALREQLNKALADIKADGTYTKLTDRWFSNTAN
jgi:polar amino acid transport system substrate-binding protein